MLSNVMLRDNSVMASLIMMHNTQCRTNTCISRHQFGTDLDLHYVNRSGPVPHESWQACKMQLSWTAHCWSPLIRFQRERQGYGRSKPHPVRWRASALTKESSYIFCSDWIDGSLGKLWLEWDGWYMNHVGSYWYAHIHLNFNIIYIVQILIVE